PFGGTSAERQISLLRQVQPYLPVREPVRIHFYADCEFRAVAVQAFCQAYQWHWQVGLKSDTYVQLADGRWRQLRELGLEPGERRFWQQVQLTQQQPFGPVNLIADWSPRQETPATGRSTYRPIAKRGVVAASVSGLNPPFVTGKVMGLT